MTNHLNESQRCRRIQIRPDVCEMRQPPERKMKQEEVTLITLTENPVCGNVCLNRVTFSTFTACFLTCARNQSSMYRSHSMVLLLPFSNLIIFKYYSILSVCFLCVISFVLSPFSSLNPHSSLFFRIIPFFSSLFSLLCLSPSFPSPRATLSGFSCCFSSTLLSYSNMGVILLPPPFISSRSIWL